MRVSLLAALLVTPLAAELRQAEIRFEPSECVSCTESLPERLRRIRGVEHAALRPGRPPTLEVRLAAGNRVRLTRIRETIEQDGTKWTSARIEASGTCEKRGEGWVIRLFEGDSGIPVKGETAAGPCELKGTVGRDGVLTLD